MIINHISVSRKQTFDKCSQAYKYRYHLKIPSPEEKPYFLYGKVVHTIAEIYVKEKCARNIYLIANDVMNKKIPIEEHDGVIEYCQGLDSEYTAKLKKHLKSIEKLTSRIGCDGFTEYEFSHDLDPPNNRNVVGFIDRLIIKDNKAFIIDYKTTKKGKFRVNNETVLTDLQLRCYARIVNMKFGIPPENIKAALYYLGGENLIAVQYNQESLLKIEEELKECYFQIEKSDPDRVWGKVGWHCKHCDYVSMCSFYNAKNGQSWNGSFEEIGIQNQW